MGRGVYNDSNEIKHDYLSTHESQVCFREIFQFDLFKEVDFLLEGTLLAKAVRREIVIQRNIFVMKETDLLAEKRGK